MPARYDIRFTGTVQGVFFRATAREVASRFAVAGWICNETDGSVRCMVEGEQAELDRFVAAVKEAKGESIADVAITSGAATGEFVGFSVKG
jgi:acylphosphatase